MTDKNADRRRPRDDAFPASAEADEFHTPSNQHNARFARAIARSVFGRHYWDDRMEEELRASRKRKPGAQRKGKS